MADVVKFPGKTVPAQKPDPLAAAIMGKLQEAMNDAQKHFPVGTPKETIIKAMENAKEGEKFSMDVLIESNLDPTSRATLDNQRIQKKLENKNRW